MATFSKTPAKSQGIPLGPFTLNRHTDGDYRRATVLLDGKLIGETPWEWRARLFRRQLRDLIWDLGRTLFPSEPLTYNRLGAC